MFKLGPITIMSSKRAKAYEEVHQDAAVLHNDLWFRDNWETARADLMVEVMILGESLSHLPDPL